MTKEISQQKKEHDELASSRLYGLANAIYKQFLDGEVPSVSMPTRTKNNIEYNDDSEVWVYGDRESERSAKTVKGAFQLLKSVHTVDFLIKNHLYQNRGSTLRELY